jgi:acetate kinase
MEKNSVLVINCGSSSLKFSLINPLTGEVAIEGIAEQLMSNNAAIKIAIFAQDNKQTKIKQPLTSPFDHQIAIELLVQVLTQHQLVEQITAVGHRVVHGGEKYSQPTLITEQVKQTIIALSKLAPLHNPANLIGITAAQHAFKDLPQVAIFDTAFHQTMPQKAYMYALPYALYQQHSIRKYGFHGTSHYFVSQMAAKKINKPPTQCSFISAHLGNGCSVTAIENGKSVDSSMGFTPLEGVMMGTRSGSIDPGIIFYLSEQLDYSLTEVNKLLNKESGLLGLSQLSNDCRALEKAAFATNTSEKNEQSRLAKLALIVFSYQIAKSIASFSASLTQLDALIFTGGIGENSTFIREQILNQLSLLNFYVDPALNQATRFGKSGNICSTTSRPCWVIPTNEEWVIAEQTYQQLHQE